MYFFITTFLLLTLPPPNMNLIIFSAIHSKIVPDKLFSLLSKYFVFDLKKHILCFFHLSTRIVKYEAIFFGILISFEGAFKISMRCLLLILKVLASEM